MVIQSSNLSRLARLYNVDYRIVKDWLMTIPGYNELKGKVIPPIIIEQLYAKYGIPKKEI